MRGVLTDHSCQSTRLIPNTIPTFQRGCASAICRPPPPSRLRARSISPDWMPSRMTSSAPASNAASATMRSRTSGQHGLPAIGATSNAFSRVKLLPISPSSCSCLGESVALCSGARGSVRASPPSTSPLFDRSLDRAGVGPGIADGGSFCASRCRVQSTRTTLERAFLMEELP